MVFLWFSYGLPKGNCGFPMDFPWIQILFTGAAASAGHFGAGAARRSRSAAADGLVERQLRVGIGQLNGGSTTAAEVVAEVVKDLAGGWV